MIHKAGEYKSKVQRCSICNYILIDDRNSYDLKGNPIDREVDKTAWTVGDNIRVDGISQSITSSNTNCKYIQDLHH